MLNIDTMSEHTVISGPHTIFENSIKVEFLEDDGFDATFLIRMTVAGSHPLVRKGKDHPLVSNPQNPQCAFTNDTRSPPLHIHFDQAETFKVLQGRWGLTAGYDQREITLTPDNEAFTVPARLPHKPWPVATDQDSIVLAWGHPRGTPNPMDVPFFEQIFLYEGKCFEDNKRPDLIQMTLSQ